MQTLNLTLILLSVLLISACQKEPASKPVKFTSTEYKLLATYDDNGKPSNIEKETVSPGLYSFSRENLPEKQDLRNSSLLTNNPTTDLRITKRAEVSVTFLSSGTGFKNAIGFYTYPTSNPPSSPKDIKVITYIFPNAGHRTPLAPGDMVRIGTFDPGVSIGFVLLQDAWNPDTKKLNNEAVHFCYSDVLNPEVAENLKKHVVLLNYAAEKRILVGFEDVDRTKDACDHDFNDIVIYTTVKEL